ncbi:MAG: type II/IV secretion system protein [Lentisphaerae bacterium]|nr:type II/IV secretion system protein [Lentisphaerota bacterium]
MEQDQHNHSNKAVKDQPVVQSVPQGEELQSKVRQALQQIITLPAEEELICGSPEHDLALLRNGKLEEKALLGVYAAATGLPLLDEQEIRDLNYYPEVTFDFLNTECCLPISWSNEQAVLAIATPYQAGRLALLWKNFYDSEVSFVLARRAFIERFIGTLYDRPDEATSGIDWDGNSEQALRDLAKEAPIVRLVNDIFTRAQESGASDIHIEPGEDEVAVRFRIDGLLQTILKPPKSQYAAIASRIKLLAGMNIAEHRLPQDGRIELGSGVNAIDVRVSTVPCMHGESIVLRLLQKDSAVFELSKIGLMEDTLEDLTKLFSMPHGMILIVGPTGSGKTTTLYCIMNILNADFRKIITIEDPVEYQLAGLTQIHVRANIGLTFANGLRAIVRQDPDVILVGEIRDRETAEIAIHAALTGHLVLSTLHTNDAAGAISRLMEMGVESFLISSALLGVASQRLVRRICTECNGSGRMPGQESRRCRNCLGSGYRGRVAIFELMIINDELRTAINSHKDSTEITSIARRHGMRTLKEDGDLKVGKGLTTAAEVSRVCQLDLGDLA